MSEMQAANLMYEASMVSLKAAQLNATIESMKAANKEREDQGKAQAYGENEFLKAIEDYR